MERRPVISMLLVILTSLLPLAGKAQEEVEYRMEIGAAGGLGFGLTDLNSKIFGNARGAGGAILRFVLNPRMAIKTSLTYTGLSGNTKNSQEFYPDPTDHNKPLDYRFSGGVVDLGGTYELNFWPYGYHRGYQGYSRITPYIQLGFGLSYGTAKAFSLNLPVGAGLKYKLKERLNVGLDWQTHFTLSDKLDGLQAPTGVKTSGFKNKDHYSTLMLTLTYSFSPKCPECNRD